MRTHINRLWPDPSNRPLLIGPDENPRADWLHEMLTAGTMRVFRQKVALEDAIGSHACSLEANMRVTNSIPLGCSLLLPVDTVNCVQTLQVVMLLM
jgi:hypothetical protein